MSRVETGRQASIHFKWLFFLFCIVLITTSVVGFSLAAAQAKEQLARKCDALASTVAAIISDNSDDYAAFLEEMDTSTAYYLATKDLMMKLKTVNVDHVAYIYTMVQVDDSTAMYGIGGEAPDSPQYTGPGIKENMSETMAAAFETRVAVLGDSFAETPYGIRMSSYAPIFHKHTGEFMGIVGADVTYSQYSDIMRSLVVQTIIGLVAGLLIFSAAVWRLSAIVNSLIKKERHEATFARELVATERDHYQKMNEMYDQVRILRHDYKYHLNATRNLLAAGNTVGANQYLAVINDKLSEYELPDFCANPVINALVADYAQRCEMLGIRFNVCLSLSDSPDISNYDLCVVLGNLLENAINACEKVSSDREINLKADRIDKQLLIMIENTFDGEIHHNEGVPASERPEGGFGLKSVTEVVDVYGGSITFEWDDARFTAFAAFKLSD